MDKKCIENLEKYAENILYVCYNGRLHSKIQNKKKLSRVFYTKKIKHC